MVIKKGARSCFAGLILVSLLLGGVPASAEPVDSQPAPHADAPPTDWQPAKAKVLKAMEPEGPIAWRTKGSRDFVLAVEAELAKAPAGRYARTLAEASAALKSGDEERLKAWILQAPDFMAADKAEWTALESHRMKVKAAKEVLLLTMSQKVTDTVVDLPLREFVYKVRDLAPAARVNFRTAAQQALDSRSEKTLEEFVLVAGISAWYRDSEILNADKNEAAKWEAKKQQVWSLCSLPIADFPTGNNDLNFLRLFIVKCEKSSIAQFMSGALSAARDALVSDQAIKSFIDGGAVKAVEADNKKFQEKLRAEAVARLRDKIEFWKKQGLRPRLIAEANRLLEGGSTGEIEALAAGVAHDSDVLKQSLSSLSVVDTLNASADGVVTVPSWGDFTGDVVDPDSTWEVGDGFATVSGRACVSLKRSGAANDPRWLMLDEGGSLRAVAVSSDDSRARATWCVHQVDGGVRLESAAATGKFLSFTAPGAKVIGGPASEKSTWKAGEPNLKKQTPAAARWHREAAIRQMLGDFRDQSFDAKTGYGVANFVQGQIIWTRQHGARAMNSGIAKKWVELGGLSAVVGVPVEDMKCGMKDGGCFVMFAGGALVWSPSLGVHDSWGPIREKWAVQHFQDGPMGYPTSDVNCDAERTLCSQNYQGGKAVWKKGQGVTVG